MVEPVEGGANGPLQQEPGNAGVPGGPLAGKVTDVSPNTLRHANITLMHELDIDDRTGRRYC